MATKQYSRPGARAQAVAAIAPLGMPKGIMPQEWRRAIEGRIEALLSQMDALIVALDTMDVDPDLESTGDEEPSLGWPERGTAALSKDMAHDDDREVENEHGGDVVDEPHDRLDEGDDEPLLGWAEAHSQRIWSGCGYDSMEG